MPSDTRILIDYLNLRTPAEVFEIIQTYYPKQLIPAKTQFLVEELLPTEDSHYSGKRGAAVFLYFS